MSMDRHNVVLKSQTIVALLVLVLLASGATAYAQYDLTNSDCGGEDDRVCEKADLAYTANYDYFYVSQPMECDYGLVNQGGYCKNNTRHQLANFVDTPLGRAVRAQLYSIGADTPVNWLSMMGTHNSFSNYDEGAVLDMVADQYWSLSDQLDAGARNLMLDVHYYDNQMRVCHDSTLTYVANCPLGQDGRLYLFAIKEIAYWLKQHPGEFVFLRINNTVDESYNYLLNEPIVAYLGDMAFTPDNFSGDAWPTLRQLRAQGKQIIIIGNNNTQWIHSWPRYVLNDAEPNTKGLNACLNDDKVDVRTRKSYQFAYIAEDRSRSGSGGDLDAYLFPLLDACGFSFMDVDFLYSTNLAVKDPTTGVDDPRPQASVWSFAPGVEPETQSPMVLVAQKMMPGQKSDVHPFACAGPGTGADQGAFPAVLYPAHHAWQFTHAADIWNNGEATCQNEFGPTYHFWAPGSGIEYGWLVFTANTLFGFNPSNQNQQLWVNYFGGPVLTGTPNTMTIKWNKTQALPAIQHMILRGGRGGALHPSASVAANQEAFFTAADTQMANSNTVAVNLNAQLASNLVPGTYTETLRIDETDPATGQTNSTRFPVTLQLTDTLLLSSSQVSLGNCGGARSARVFVKSGGNFDLVIGSPWIHVTADSYTSPATLVITADPSGLSAGLHMGSIKVHAPNTTNGGAGIEVGLNVAPEMTISSTPAINIPITVDGQTFTGSRDFCWQPATAHTISAPASNVIASGQRWKFTSWSDGGAASHTILQPNAASALTATYDMQYRVTATVGNPAFGTVVVSPTSTDGYYNLGTTVTFTAKPKSGHSFSNFVFNGSASATNPLAVQVTVPVNVVAEFH